MGYITVTCRCLLGLVFLIAVVSKLRNRSAYRAFERSVDDLTPAFNGGTRAVAVATVVVEASVVMLLLPGPFPIAVGFGLAAGLLLAFTGAILAALRRGVRAQCRCFGGSTEPLGRRHAVRNGLLLLATLTGAVAHGSTAALEPAGTAVAAAVGVVGAVLLMHADELIYVFPGRRPRQPQSARSY